MKIFIVGGTGFLGYHATLELLKRKHSVSTLSLPDIELGSWFPIEAEVAYGDVFRKTDAELAELFRGYDALIYAVGPDDRVLPAAPAYRFFHERLVAACGRVVAAARIAGVKRCVVLNSYFAYFHRERPLWKLAEHHPYIKVRMEQAERVMEEGTGGLSVAVLELPYIFGTMPGRVPLWKDALLDRIFKMNPVLYTRGGSNMMTVEAVGEAIAGLVESDKTGRVVVGDENVSWKTMLSVMFQALGIRRKVWTVPTFLTTLYGRMLRRNETKEGKEAGLNHAHLFKDIQARELYFDAASIAEELGYRRGGVAAAIAKTVRACYPEGLA